MVIIFKFLDPRLKCYIKSELRSIVYLNNHGKYLENIALDSPF